MGKVNSIIIALLVITVIIAGCKSISKEEAIVSAKLFVEKDVKFFVNEDDNEDGILNKPEVSINIINIQEEKDEWIITLYAQANRTGEIKKGGLVVVVDSRTGEVKKEKTKALTTSE